MPIWICLLTYCVTVFAGDPNQLPHLTNAFVEQYGLSMRDEIRRERRSEMSGESTAL